MFCLGILLSFLLAKTSFAQYGDPLYGSYGRNFRQGGLFSENGAGGLGFTYVPSFRDEYRWREIVNLASKKIDLLQAALAIDPDAQLFDEVVRDFALAILKRTSVAYNEAEFQQIENTLYQTQVFKVREFLKNRSRVVIIPGKGKLEQLQASLKPEDFGIETIEYRDRQADQWHSDQFFAEGKRAIIAVNRMRIGRTGWIPGDGSRQIFESRISFGFPSGINLQSPSQDELVEQVLSILAYMRALCLVENNQTRRYQTGNRIGHRVEDLTRLFGREFQMVFANAARLTELSKANAARINTAVEGVIYAFPGLAHSYFEAMGVHRMLYAHASLNEVPDFLLDYHRDFYVQNLKIKRFGIEESLFYKPLHTILPDHALMTDTGTFERFRDAARDEVLHTRSEYSRTAVLAMAPADYLSLVRDGRASDDYAVTLHISRTARAVDLTEAYGRSVYREFAMQHPNLSYTQVLNEMAEALDIDLIKYADAAGSKFFVRNRAVIDAISPRRLLSKTFSQIVHAISDMKTMLDLKNVLYSLMFFSFTTEERQIITDHLQRSRLDQMLDQSFGTFEVMRLAPRFSSHDFTTRLSQIHKSRDLASHLLARTNGSAVRLAKGLKESGLLNSPELLGVLQEQLPTNFISSLRESGFSLSEVLSVLRVTGINGVDVSRDLLPNLTTPQSILTALEVARIASHAESESSVVEPFVAAFFEKSPNHLDIRALTELYPNDVNWLMKIWSRALNENHIRTPTEFLEIVRRPEGLQTVDFNRLNRFFVALIPKFLSLQPSPTVVQIKQFQVMCLTSLHDAMTMVQVALQNPDVGPAEYVEMVSPGVRAELPERMAFDNLLRQTLAAQVQSAWSIEHLKSLIARSAATGSTAQHVWKIGLQSLLQHSHAQDPQRAKDFSSLIAAVPNVSHAEFLATLNEFILESVQQIALLPFDQAALSELLSSTYISSEAAKELFAALAKRHPHLLELAKIVEILESAPLNVRLGFNSYLDENLQVYLRAKSEVSTWFKLMTQIQLSAELTYAVATKVLDDPKNRTSEVFELLQGVISTNAQLDVVELFSERFRTLPFEKIETALALRLPDKQRIYILMLAYFSLQNDEAAWLKLITNEVKKRPALGVVLLQMKRKKAISLLERVPVTALGFTHMDIFVERCSNVLRRVRR